MTSCDFRRLSQPCRLKSGCKRAVLTHSCDSLRVPRHPAFRTALSMLTLLYPVLSMLTGCSAWPVFQHDAQRTGRSIVNTSTDTGVLHWTSSVADFGSGPVLGSNTIYMGSHGNNLYALNLDGSLKWEFPIGNVGNAAAPGVAAIGTDGTIYLPSADSNLYAINGNGTLKWKFVLPPSYGATPSVPAIAGDSTIYIGDFCGNFYAIAPGGVLDWKFTQFANANCVNGEGTPVTPPALGSDGTIYAGNSNALFALTPGGTMKWLVNLSNNNGGDFGVVTGPVVAGDGTIYVNTGNHLYAIRPDGTQKWQIYIPNNFNSSPALGPDGTIYVGAADAGAGYPGGLYAVTSEGTIRWLFNPGDGDYLSSPAIGGEGTIYVGSLDNNLYAVNPNGSLKWSYNTRCGILDNSPIFGEDGTIYLSPDYTDPVFGGCGAGDPTHKLLAIQ